MLTTDGVVHVCVCEQDKDGRLGPGELEVLLGMSSGVDLSQLDTDGDGYVTHEEVAASIRRGSGSAS